MKNIFQNAQFGDKYLTRGNKTAVYINKSNVYEPLAGKDYSYVTLILKDGSLIKVCEENGLHPTNDYFDITSRYKQKFNISIRSRIPIAPLADN